MTNAEAEQIEAVKAELRVVREQLHVGSAKSVVLELMILNLKRTVEELQTRYAAQAIAHVLPDNTTVLNDNVGLNNRVSYRAGRSARFGGGR